MLLDPLSTESEDLQEVDLLFFEVGDSVYGTDASQVIRIDRALADAPALEDLGTLKRGTRAIVFDTPEGEAYLRVDSISGVRPTPIVSLRRLPSAVIAAPYAIGLVLEEEARLVMLIDLVATLKAQGRH
jgi:hypothetical protein